MNVYQAMNWIKSVKKEKFSKNLIGIGWGPKTVRGIETGEYCLVFNVSQKKPLSELLPNEVIPSYIIINYEHYVTDIVEIKQDIPYVLDCNTISDIVPPVSLSRQKVRPLMGGTESETSWGSFVATLGILVRDKSDGQIVGLSNNHVFGASQVHGFYNATNSNGFKNTEPLSSFQPTGYYRTTQSADFIGKAKRSVVIGDSDYRIAFGTTITDSSCDAAITSINSTLIDTISSPSIMGFNANPPFKFASDEEINSLLDTNSVNFAAPVFKCGRTTGPIGFPGNTYSCSTSVYQFNTAYVGAYSGYSSYFSNSFWVRGNIVPGRGGDSGSAFFALLSAGIPSLSAWKCIGLLFAGPGGSFPDYTVGCRISEVTDGLDIVPWDCTLPTLTAKTELITTNNYPSLLTSSKISLSGRTYFQLGRP